MTYMPGWSPSPVHFIICTLPGDIFFSRYPSVALARNFYYYMPYRLII